MISDKLHKFESELPSGVKLVAVSKYHSLEEMREAYDAGQRVFAENRPQDFISKVKAFEDMSLPVEWHFIGHLQTNKLKMVLPYASLVQSVDSRRLLDAIQAWAAASGKKVEVLLELHIASEQTKTGFTEEEILEIMFDREKYPDVVFRGLMGMATHTDDEQTVEADFERIDSFMAYLVDLFPECSGFDQLSIGMSDDWHIAVRHGATMVRIGSAIFN